MSEKKEKQYVSDNAQLMAEWDWENNDKLGLNPDDISVGSTIKIWWKCKDCDNCWQTTAGHRCDAKKPTGCPKCSAKKRAQERREKLLADENITLKFPELLDEWNYEKNIDISPKEITIGSHTKIWWTCKEGHSWQTIVRNRIKGYGCPYCSGRLAIKGKNDLLTVNPFLALEWNNEKNSDLHPNDVTANAGKKVWWRCSTCGNEWESTIANRNKKRGCPSCSAYRHHSIPEKAIFFYLSKYYTDIESNKKFDWLKNMELDIYIPRFKLAIEYDGRVWHQDQDRDILKDTLCNTNGIQLIRIREFGLSFYETTAKLFATKEPTLDLLYLKPTLLEIIHYIRENYDNNLEIDIDFERDYYNILGFAQTCLKETSLAYKFPELLKEWNFDLNNNLDPYNISSGSSRKVWWICENGHQWKTSVANRTNISNLNKCPYCQVKRVTRGSNDLITIGAPFLVDWDYDKNATSPNNYTIHSGKVVWWKCHICGYEWKSTIDSRSKHACFKCSREKIKKTKSKMVENIDTHIIYSSAVEAARKNNLYEGAVSRCCRGERKTAGGYHWRYLDGQEESFDLAKNDSI